MQTRRIAFAPAVEQSQADTQHFERSQRRFGAFIESGRVPRRRIYWPEAAFFD
jgi:hypothetical protein